LLFLGKKMGGEERGHVLLWEGDRGSPPPALIPQQGVKKKDSVKNGHHSSLSLIGTQAGNPKTDAFRTAWGKELTTVSKKAVSVGGGLGETSVKKKKHLTERTNRTPLIIRKEKRSAIEHKMCGDEPDVQ